MINVFDQWGEYYVNIAAKVSRNIPRMIRMCGKRVFWLPLAIIAALTQIKIEQKKHHKSQQRNTEKYRNNIF